MSWITCRVGHSVTINWRPGDNREIRFNLYRGESPEGPWTKLTRRPILSTVWIDVKVKPGVIYYYYVTSVGHDEVELGHSELSVAEVPDE
jgi:fibronectin type 3 domain-containing protein